MNDIEKKVEELVADIEIETNYSKLSHTQRFFFIEGMKARIVEICGVDDGVIIWKKVVDRLEEMFHRKNNQLHQGGVWKQESC